MATKAQALAALETVRASFAALKADNTTLAQELATAETGLATATATYNSDLAEIAAKIDTITALIP